MYDDRLLYKLVIFVEKSTLIQETLLVMLKQVYTWFQFLPKTNILSNQNVTHKFLDISSLCEYIKL